MNKETENKTLNGAANIIAVTVNVCVVILLLAVTAKIVLWLLF